MASIKERTEIARESKRDIPNILQEIETLATLSNDVALSCFYVVFSKEDNKPYIGISVRFAELIASTWGNIHTGAKVTANNGTNLTVQGFVHDFEKNAVFTVEVQRYIGKLSPERIIQATNAASSIAFRNAIFKAIPAAVTYTITNNIKKYITENINGGSVVKDVLNYFKSKKIGESDLSKLIGNEIEDITPEQLFLLIGLRNAIEEGDTTVAEIFGKGQGGKPQRSSKFAFETKDEDPIAEIPEPTFDPKDFKEVPLKEETDVKASLKNGLSDLAKKPKVEEIVIGDIPKVEEPIKKRGRGRPKKD